MSMIMMLESVASETAEERSATVLIHSPDSWSVGTQVGGYGDNNLSNSISLEKAWHGIHYLLAGDPWAGRGYRGFLVHGGIQVGEASYGPIRVFAPHEVKEIAKLLDSISSDELWSGYSQERFEGADIYPDIWEESEDALREEYTDYYESLKEFVAQTASDGNSLQIALV
jgi:hypothetical protein